MTQRKHQILFNASLQTREKCSKLKTRPIIEQRWTPRSLQEFLYGSPQEINPASLYEKIKAKFDFYIDFGESKGASEFCALYTMLSYFYPLFEYVPYFKLGGEKGVAKTKCGNIFAALGFNGDIFANASAASIYRMAQDTRGIMVIDEAEGLAFKSEERQAYQDVLNSGWQRNGNVPRTNKDTMRVERLGTFCPKVICSIGGLYDVLEDRAFEVILLKTLDSEKGSREVGRSSLEWKPIRDELYLCLMQYWKQVQEMQIQNKFEILVDKSAFWNDIPEEWRALHDESIKRIHGDVKTTYWLDFQLPGRLWNLCKPIMTIAALVDAADPKLNVMDALTGFIYSKMLDKDSKVEATLTASVIEALEQVLKAMDPSKNYLDMREVILGEVVDKVREIEGDDARNAQGEYWIKPKTVAAVLRNLNLYSKISKSHGKMKFVVTDKAVGEAKARLSSGLKIGGFGGRGGDDTAENRELALLWAGSQSNSTKKFNLPSFIPRVTQSIKSIDSDIGQLSVLTGVTSPISPESPPMRDIPPPDSKAVNLADVLPTLDRLDCRACGQSLDSYESLAAHLKTVHSEIFGGS